MCKITTIRERAFYSCSSISTFATPDSVISIENYAFSWTGLINITIKNSVKLIEKGIFSSCYKLINATIPTHLTYMPHGIFAGCEALETFSIPPNVTSIEDFAFSKCKKLKNINIPSKLISIGEESFIPVLL